jgi:cytochrome P450 family 628
MAERKKRQPKERDVMLYILECGPFFRNEKRDDLLLIGDARLLIVAGSDTTATTLAYLFYHLAHEPSLVEGVRKELIENNVVNDETFDVQALQHLPYLNAVITETLRLHPPVPGGVYRLTPAEGVTPGGHWVPGGVKIVQPIYTIQRCEY